MTKKIHTDLEITGSLTVGGQPVTGGSGIPDTLLDAKGDLIVASAADTATRLAAGTDGQVLTADSAEVTGLKWADSAAGAPLLDATGGVVTDLDGYRYHTFTANSTLDIVAGGDVAVLAVAGGGGGGKGDSFRGGGGGGAGGMIVTTQTLTPGSYPVVIGSAGLAGTSANGGNGGDSTFNSLTAVGGGGGGFMNAAGNAGGSGGGGGARNGAGGSATATQGNAGGTAGGSDADSAGGGGAGGVGTANNITGGGPGSLWLNSITYAAGGHGGQGGNSPTVGNTVANTGNGGNGGGGGWSNGLAGATGIVIVRYAIPITPVSPTIVNAKGDLIVGSAPDAVTRLGVGTNTQILAADSAEATGLKWVNSPSASTIGQFLFSRPGVAAIVTGVGRMYNPRSVPLSFTSARASVNTAPTGADLIVTVIKNGVTTLITLTITAGTYTSGRMAFTDTIADGDYITINITQFGSTIPGSDLVVQLEYA